MEEAGIYTGKWDFCYLFLWFRELHCGWLAGRIGWTVISRSSGIVPVWNSGCMPGGCLSAATVFFYIRYLFSLGGYEGIKGRGFLYMACILLAISVWIPYDPEHFPKASLLHVVFSFSFPVLLALSLLSFFKRKDPLRSQPVSSDALAVCRACGSGSCTVVCLRLYHRPFGSVCNHCLLWISGFG